MGGGEVMPRRKYSFASLSKEEKKKITDIKKNCKHDMFWYSCGKRGTMEICSECGKRRHR